MAQRPCLVTGITGASSFVVAEDVLVEPLELDSAAHADADILKG